MPKKKPEPAKRFRGPVVFRTQETRLPPAEAEKLKGEVQFEEATFYYRRVSLETVRGMERSCTNRHTGIINWTDYKRLFLVYALTGWKDLLDSNGKELSFSKEMIPYIPPRLKLSLFLYLGADTLHRYLGKTRERSLGKGRMHLSRRHPIARTVQVSQVRVRRAKP